MQCYATFDTTGRCGIITKIYNTQKTTTGDGGSGVTMEETTDNKEGDTQQLEELFGSESDEDVRGRDAQNVDMKDLFGSDEEEDGGMAAGERLDDDTPAGEMPVVNESMDIPVNLYDGLPPKNMVLAKLPNSLRIEPTAFVQSDFQGDVDRVPTIRWRHDVEKNELVRESNARVVTWSDGSRTLHVGKDAFQVKSIDVKGDHTFLYVRHPNLVQCQSKFVDKYLFNPIGVDKADRPKVRVQQASRVKVKQTATLVDPMKEREEKEKAEEARIKDKEKLQEKQKQHMRRSIMQSKVPPARSQRYLSAAFLEGDDDDDGYGYQEEILGQEYGDDYDDGFIVSDDDGEEEGEQAGEEEGEQYEEKTFERLTKRKEIDEEEEEKGAERLTDILVNNTDDGSGGGVAAKKRAVLIDSDSD